MVQQRSPTVDNALVLSETSSRNFVPWTWNAARIPDSKSREFYHFLFGKVAEWLIAPILKIGVAQVTEGSNPSLSVYLPFFYRIQNKMFRLPGRKSYGATALHAVGLCKKYDVRSTGANSTRYKRLTQLLKHAELSTATYHNAVHRSISCVNYL